MGLAAQATKFIAALLGISAYAAPSAAAASASVDPEQVDKMREAMGGQLQPPAISQTRWYLSDLESAEFAADAGNLTTAARLMRAARKDGVLGGVLSTRTAGLVRLPKRFRGDPDVIAALELGHDVSRSVFDEMFPAAELALMAADGELLGIAVAEMVPVEGRDYPVLVRLDPEFLTYYWHENRWYFRSIAGMIPITPGDGRWILHTPGGRMAPWQHGLWRAIGRAFIRKEHASLYKDAWEAKLANPARVAIAPQGASEQQKESWFQRVMAWGVNTVFGMTPGYDVKLLESNGRGYDSFLKTIAQSDNEIIIAVAGQTVTTDGGAGFANADIHKSIRADLIKATADALAYTINTQGLPAFVLARWGMDKLIAGGAVVEWDVAPPQDLNASANALVSAANAIERLATALAGHGLEVDVMALATQFGVPIKGKLQVEAAPQKVDLAPTDIAKVIRVREARAAQKLPPLGDYRDDLTVYELGELASKGAENTNAGASPAAKPLKVAA